MFLAEIDLNQLDYIKAYPWNLFRLAGRLSGPGLLSRIYEKLIFTPKGMWTLEGHDGTVNAVAICPTGHRAFSASEDKTVRVWDLKSGREMKVLDGHTCGVSVVGATPDGRSVISVDERGELIVWDTDQFEIIQRFQLRACMLPSAIAINSNGDTILVGDSNGGISVVMTGSSNPEMPESLNLHSGRVRHLLTTGEAARFVSAGDDGRVIEWTLSNRSPVASYTANHAIERLIELGSEELLAIDHSGELHFLERRACSTAAQA